MALQGEAKKAYQREYMARKRALGLGLKEAAVESVTSETGGVTPEPAKVHRTRTDALFEARLPGYYVYEENAVERECWMCGGAFKTRLELNKFCGPTCKEKWLSEAFGKLKGVKK